LEDRNEIFDYIEKENPHGATVIDGRISEQVEQLLPFLATGRKGRIQGTREPVIHGTAYIASYLVEIDVVYILRVLHGARRWPNEM
jgi:toxin ParE1/3/4